MMQCPSPKLKNKVHRFKWGGGPWKIGEFPNFDWRSPIFEISYPGMHLGDSLENRRFIIFRKLI